jgi:hypothetical protein
MKSFHSLQGIDFFKKAFKREFTIKWKPILKMMELYPGFVLLA